MFTVLINTYRHTVVTSVLIDVLLSNLYLYRHNVVTSKSLIAVNEKFMVFWDMMP